MSNYLTISNILKQFGVYHNEIRRVKVSFVEQLDNFSTEGDSFPILYVIPTDIQYQTNSDVYTFRVYCVDILQKDRSNEGTILNSTSAVLRDLTNWLKNSYENGIPEMLNEPISIPVNNFLVDFTAGWYIDVVFDAQAITSDCVIPFANNFQFTGVTCDIQALLPYLTCETLEFCSAYQNIVNNSVNSNFLLSGGTDLYNIFQSIGSDTGSSVSLLSTQIAYGSSANTITSSSGITYNNETLVIQRPNIGPSVVINNESFISGGDSPLVIKNTAVNNGFDGIMGLGYSSTFTGGYPCIYPTQLGIGLYIRGSGLYGVYIETPNQGNANSGLNVAGKVRIGDSQFNTGSHLEVKGDGWFSNSLAVGKTSAASASLDIPASTALLGSLMIRSGVTNGTIITPLDGMINNDGTNLYGYIGGSWQQLNNVSGTSFDCSVLTGCSYLNSTFVPYTGATANVRLGANVLFLSGNGATGGYITLGRTGVSTTVPQPASGLNIAASSGGRLLLGWSGDAFTRAILPGTLTGGRNYTLPDATGTLALTNTVTLAMALRNSGFTAGFPIRYYSAVTGDEIYVDSSVAGQVSTYNLGTIESTEFTQTDTNIYWRVNGSGGINLFQVTSAGNFNVSSTVPNFPGMQYGSDYSADFVGLSLINKDFADNRYLRYSGSSLVPPTRILFGSASSGLTSASAFTYNTANDIVTVKELLITSGFTGLAFRAYGEADFFGTMAIFQLGGSGTRYLTTDNFGNINATAIPTLLAGQPSGQVVYGLNGTGITSDSNFTYDGNAITLGAKPNFNSVQINSSLGIETGNYFYNTRQDGSEFVNLNLYEAGNSGTISNTGLNEGVAELAYYGSIGLIVGTFNNNSTRFVNNNTPMADLSSAGLKLFYLSGGSATRMLTVTTGGTVTATTIPAGGTVTYVQPGLNTYTGGTASLPTVNISAATLVSLSATTISGGTLFSGSTPLSFIINNAVTGATSLTSQRVAFGSTGNTITGSSNFLTDGTHLSVGNIFSLDTGSILSFRSSVNGVFGVRGLSFGAGAAFNYGGDFFAGSSTQQNVAVQGVAFRDSEEAAVLVNIGGNFDAQGATTNYGGMFNAAAGTNNYSVRLLDGTQGLGKVLTDVTGSGDANWRTPPAHITGVSYTFSSSTLSLANSSGGTLTATNVRTLIASAYTQAAVAATTFTVPIGQVMANTNYLVVVSPTNVLSAAVFYINNKTTTTFDVVYLAGLTGSVSFDWHLTP